MLEECWMKVSIVCTCHPICFIQYTSPFTLLFNVKSKMATGMLLPVILSELVNSDDEKPRLGKTRERISFLNLFLSVSFEYFLWSACFFFFRYLQFLLLHPYSSPFCSCNLDRWSESSLLLRSFRFDVYDFYCVWYFAERFSFVESFEIQSSNLWNDVIRMKCWMKPRIDQSNMKILLDEPENVVWNICSRSNFHSTRFFFIEHDFFLFFCYFCVLLNRSNISSSMAFLLCWMRCWIGLTRLLENSSTFTGKKSTSKSLFK